MRTLVSPSSVAVRRHPQTDLTRPAGRGENSLHTATCSTGRAAVSLDYYAQQSLVLPASPTQVGCREVVRDKSWTVGLYRPACVPACSHASLLAYSILPWPGAGLGEYVKETRSRVERDRHRDRASESAVRKLTTGFPVPRRRSSDVTSLNTLRIHSPPPCGAPTTVASCSMTRGPFLSRLASQGHSGPARTQDGDPLDYAGLPRRPAQGGAALLHTQQEPSPSTSAQPASPATRHGDSAALRGSCHAQEARSGSRYAIPVLLPAWLAVVGHLQMI